MKEETFVNKVLHGLGVSSGIAIGKVYLLERGRIHVEKYSIKEDQIEKEIAKFQDAIKSAVKELNSIKETIPDDDIRKHAFIIDAHILMLQDQFFLKEVVDTIKVEEGQRRMGPRYRRLKISEQLRKGGRPVPEGKGTGSRLHLPEAPADHGQERGVGHL